MKQQFKTGLIAMSLSLISTIGLAQASDNFIPRWVSKKGFWVVESKADSPGNHVILFYNNNNVLVYKETLSNVKLNLERGRVKMKLKKILETSVLAYDKNSQKSEELALVRTAL